MAAREGVGSFLLLGSFRCIDDIQWQKAPDPVAGPLIGCMAVRAPGETLFALALDRHHVYIAV